MQWLSRRHIYLNGIWILTLVAVLGGASSLASAQRAIVEIEKIQVVHAISGVIRDPVGSPIPGAMVAEVSTDGKTVIQSTTTDKTGSFAIVPKAKRKVYDLKISCDPNFNPLIVHVRVSRWTRKLLDLKLYLST